MEEEMKDGAVPEQVETENVKCDYCGSNMKFDPESQMLYCEHCGRKESFAVYVQADELAIEDALKTGGASWAEETKVFRCENCGEDYSITYKRCPFCDEKAAEEKKAEARRAQKDAQEKRIRDGKNQRDEHAAERVNKTDEASEADWENTVTITASSIEELLKKISDYQQNERMNTVQTKEDRLLGGHIAYKG